MSLCQYPGCMRPAGRGKVVGIRNLYCSAHEETKQQGLLRAKEIMARIREANARFEANKPHQEK